MAAFVLAAFSRKGISMNFKGQSFVALVTAAFLCVSSSTAFASFRITSSHTQHKVSSGKFPIHTACMMPPQGSLTRIGMKGAEGMSKESEAWRGSLENLVESHLKTDGITIESATNPLSSGASEDEIRGVISQVQLKMDAVYPVIVKKPGEVSKSAYTLGDQVAMLPCSEKADILVFVEGEGQVLTDNRAGMTFLVGGPAEGALVLVTMADAKTGEILGFIRIYSGSGFLDNPETEIGVQLENELIAMNIGIARKNIRAHPR
jgi:hypothetical protein